MTKAWFEYKGVNSLSKYLEIENSISFASPEADIEFIEVLGKDGDVAIDNGRLKGVTFPINMRLAIPQDAGKTVNDVATEISNWFKNDIGWYPLTFSGSPDYEYMALVHEQFDILERLKTRGQVTINFRLKPYKRRVDSPTLTLSNGQNIENPELRTSKPLIRIEAQGNIKLMNNGEDWLFINQNGGVDDSIIIDSDLMQAYKNVPIDPNRFNRMYGELPELFPLLSTGDNVITWTGNVFNVEIEPRWEAVT